jgi:hypothetical protein
MIKANELRIGNLVMDDDDSHDVFNVEEITKGKSETENMWFINGRWSEDVLPIPLTHEILEKCGFEKEEDYYSYEGFKLWYNDYNFYHMNSEMLIHVDYLHQLQNLYFALNGEELAVNL